VSYPDQVPSGKIDTKTVGHITDILPSILDLADLEYPSRINDRKITPISSQSLLPAFYGEKTVARDTLFWEHQFHRAVRVGDWKLVAPFKIRGRKEVNKQWELYNLEQDPTEQNNLAARYPDQVEALSNAYENWAQKVNVLTKVEMDSLKRLNGR
jgi:arylsulfatase